MISTHTMFNLHEKYKCVADHQLYENAKKFILKYLKDMDQKVILTQLEDYYTDTSNPNYRFNLLVFYHMYNISFPQTFWQFLRAKTYAVH